jgi:hypothetical protein
MKKTEWAALAVFLLCVSAALPALADPVRDAEEAIRRRDVAGALEILERASSSGNQTAKAALASYLRNFPPPYRNTERACQLARETSDAGEPLGQVTRAECLITGAEKIEQPFETARDLARKAWKAGSPAGGFMLYMVFTLDPAYSYTSNGKVDEKKYAELAAMPLSARSTQIEALEGLAGAVRGGHVNALVSTVAYLADSSSPENMKRMLGAAGLLQKVGEKIPQRLIPYVSSGRTLQALGSTNLSVKGFNDAYPTALIGASIMLRANGETACKDVKLTGLKAEPVADAEYLPLPKPLENTYLVRGNWEETWTFSGCDKTVPVQMKFSADGWGGMHYSTRQAPKS